MGDPPLYRLGLTCTVIELDDDETNVIVSGASGTEAA